MGDVVGVIKALTPASGRVALGGHDSGWVVWWVGRVMQCQCCQPPPRLPTPPIPHQLFTTPQSRPANPPCPALWSRGLVAWFTACAHPELVERLCILCIPHPACFLPNLDRNQCLR